MPRISEFYGIVVWLYYDEHPPPHFHATYGEHVVQVAIDSLNAMAGSLPTRAMRLLREWGQLHQGELAAMWDTAMAHEALGKIEALP